MHDHVLRAITMHRVRISPKTCWTFLRLHTHGGHLGEGEASLTLLSGAVHTKAMVSAAERLAPLLLQQFRLDSPSEFAKQNAPTDIYDASIVSALDQAIWSLHAQHAGQMLAQVLGVKRTHIPLYANINRRTEVRTPEGFSESARAAMDAGYLAFKLAPFDEVNTDLCSQGLGFQAMQAGLERIAAVRKAVGKDARLMVDCHWRFDEATARELNEAAARMGVFWIECPLPEVEENIPALVRLRRQTNSLGMHQAGLEMSIGWEAYRPYCEAGAYDVVMPDIKYAGGIHEMLAISDGCKNLGIDISPHNPSGPICHASSLHLAAALDTFDMLEVQFDESPLFDALVGSTFAPVAIGQTVLPAANGLGVALDDVVMQQNAESPIRIWTANEV